MDLKKLNMKFVSDLIGEDYQNWKSGDIVKIKSPTGTGKNYFVSNILVKSLDNDERILYICNRTALRKEVILDMYSAQNMTPPLDAEGEYDWPAMTSIANIGKVIIRTYQDITESIRNKLDINFSDYKYVIFDECHYLLNDTFNKKTDIPYDEIIKYHETAKIFMSATMDNLESDIDNLANRYDTSLYCYNQSADYSYIKPHVFKSINDMATLIKNDTSNDKWIIFIYSKSQAKSYMDIIGAEHCLYVDKDQAKEIETVVSKKTFDKKVLISTCVLDNGINIIDDKVKHIVIHESNKTKFVQMLGRIRHHRDIDGLYQQNINLYIPKLWKNNFSGKLGKMNKYLEQAELYKHNNKKFLKLYDRDFNKLSGELFYIDEGIKLNRVGLKALKINIEHYQSMVDGLEDNKYYFDINLRLGWLCLMDYEEIESVVDNEEIESLSDYLEMIEGKRLYANDIEILTKYIVEEISKVKIAKRYKSFKPSTIEKILRDELNMQYAIISSREDKIIDGKRIRNRYYIISEITNDNLKIS